MLTERAPVAEKTEDRIIRNDSEYYIEENINYPEGEGNLFLIKKPDYFTHSGIRCGGGVDSAGAGTGKWVALMHVSYEEETGSDAVSVYEGTSREEAINALWSRRFIAQY